jgi:hypothetical protein
MLAFRALPLTAIRHKRHADFRRKGEMRGMIRHPARALSQGFTMHEQPRSEESPPLSPELVRALTPLARLLLRLADEDFSDTNLASRMDATTMHPRKKRGRHGADDTMPA